MSNQYKIYCDCGSIKMVLSGDSIVHAFCHCEDCRTLLKIPYHSVTAWQEEQVEMFDESGLIGEFQHPELSMKRFFCTNCGETLFNTNKMDWRVVSQLLIRKCCKNKIPDELSGSKHFFYGKRVVDIDDDLIKQD